MLNCNKTNLTYIRVLSTCVQLQVYLTVVTVVQVHGSVHSFIKSISSSNPRTIKVVVSSALQCGYVVLSATHPLAHTRITSQNAVAALGHAHRQVPHVSANCAGEIWMSLVPYPACRRLLFPFPYAYSKENRRRLRTGYLFPSLLVSNLVR